ncbi:MAG TPA: hypothetical protein VGC97_05190 [Pyrinomonadaceae bacterium]|jgi:hypothetical protein
MGLLRLLIRGSRDAAEEYSAKRDLERKLGRKVSEEELYSLGSHLDAAGPGNGQMPLVSTPRESSVPFGDAKPPMTFTKKLLLFGIPLLLLCIILPVAYVGLMSEYEYNRINPWTPKPPAGTFPAQMGAFHLKQSPDWNGVKSYNPAENWEGEYTNGTNYIKYKFWNYKSEAELNEAFDKQKKYITPSSKFKIFDDSPARYSFMNLSGESVYVLYKDGTQLKQLTGSGQQPIYEFEGLLKNTAPAAVVPVNYSELKAATDSNNNSPLTVVQLLDDYKKDSDAADKKYKGKTIIFKGTVEVADKDKEGKPMIAFLRPGAKNPNEGMVACSFDKSQESVVSKVKKGDTVLLQGKVFGSIMDVMIIQNCTKF